MRPHQWVKNLFVLAPFVFAQELLEPRMAVRAALAFLLFSLGSSAVYLLNDLADLESDRTHPVKCRRPIASGRVSVPFARWASALLAGTALAVGFVLSPWYAASLLGYLILNVAYSSKLKHVAYLDVLCIATGFELRVVAGAMAAMVTPSAYLLVVTFLLALFLGFGKRMHELKQGQHAHRQRSALRAYDERTVQMLLYLTSAATVTTYGVYTVDPDVRAQLGTEHLIVTIFFTVFGVQRFLYLVQGRPEAESPTEEMLRDPLFLLNLVAWVVAVFVVIYVT